jgi:hypothetical protein
VGDMLVPKTEDVNAEYTSQAYGFNLPQKTRLRKMRRQLLDWYEKVSELLKKLGTQIDQGNLDAIETHRELYRTLRLLRQDVLDRYQAIPQDADEACSCEEQPPKELPPPLAKQMIKNVPLD